VYHTELGTGSPSFTPISPSLVLFETTGELGIAAESHIIVIIFTQYLFVTLPLSATVLGLLEYLRWTKYRANLLVVKLTARQLN
jgi:hypothetical protein